MTQSQRGISSKAEDNAANAIEMNAPPVEGDETEPDASRTPEEFADEEMMTVEQAANFLQVPATRVRGFIEDGTLATHAEGSVERIKRSEVNRIGNPDDGAAKEFEKDHKAAEGE